MINPTYDLLTPRSDQNVTSSLKYPHIIQQTGNENTQTYQIEVLILIYQQILLTNSQGN